VAINTVRLTSSRTRDLGSGSAVSDKDREYFRDAVNRKSDLGSGNAVSDKDREYLQSMVNRPKRKRRY
jgi:hypothetical protein